MQNVLGMVTILEENGNMVGDVKAIFYLNFKCSMVLHFEL